MRRLWQFFLLLAAGLLPALLAQAQYQSGPRPQRTPLVSYLFEDYSPATVLFKSGLTAQAHFNYNLLTEEMVFERYGRLLALEVPDIDTIYIGNRTFIPVDKAFYEVVHTPFCTFYIRHQHRLVNKGKPAGYGGYSETSAISTLSGYVIDDVYIPLQVPGADLKDESRLWIRNDTQFFEASTPRQLQKVFPAHRKTIRQFAAQHKIERFTQQEMLQLLLLLHKQQR